MKILFLSENYYPKVSGVPIVTQYLAEGLHNQGHNVYIATRKYNFKEQEVINGINVFRFNIKRNWIKTLCGDIASYQKFILNENFDVIIAECTECAVFDAFLPIIHKIKAQTILHSHGMSVGTKPFFKWEGLSKSTFGYMYNWFYYRWYYKYYLIKYLKYFDKTICLSEIASDIKYFSKNSKDNYILPNAINEDFLKKTRPVQELQIKNLNMPYCISCANYQSIKNQKGILKQFFLSDITNLAMVFIGREKNKYYESLIKLYKRLCKKYGIKKVLFLTKIERSKIPDIIGNAKLYLVGSVFEEYSLSIIEAMSKGVPFVSTNVGNSRILPGGITINKLNEMSKEIRYLTDNPKICMELGEKGQQYVRQNCQKEKIINKLLYIINNNIN